MNEYGNTILQTKTAHRDGEGDVTFTLNDGSTFTIPDVRVESVGPAAESPGVIGVEFYDTDVVIHVPFVRYWTFDYRL